jgi:hypothetical protein
MMFDRLLAVLALFCAFGGAAPVKILVTTYDGSITYSLGNATNSYYVPSPANCAAVGNYSIGSAEVFVPFTIMVLNAAVISASLIEDTLGEYAKDNVYTSDFLVGSLATLSRRNLANSLR